MRYTSNQCVKQRYSKSLFVLLNFTMLIVADTLYRGRTNIKIEIFRSIPLVGKQIRMGA